MQITRAASVAQQSRLQQNNIKQPEYSQTLEGLQLQVSQRQMGPAEAGV